jgi:hypothetical protein
MSRVSHGAVVPQENLGHQIGGLFLSSSGLIRFIPTELKADRLNLILTLPTMFNA